MARKNAPSIGEIFVHRIRSKRGRAGLAASGLLLVIAPIVGPQFLIAYQTRDDARRDVTEVATESVARAERAIDAGLNGLTELSLLGVSHCDARALGFMRRAVYTNYAIKAVGLIDANGQILCNDTGDLVPIKVLSHSYPSRDPKISLQLVDLHASNRRGVLLAWALGDQGSLNAIVPGETIAQDLVPRSLRATAVGKMTLPDGTLIAAIPERGGAAAPSEIARDLISVEVRSQRYPVVMSLAVPFQTFRSQNGTLFTYADVGGVLVSGLICGLILYAVRGPPGEIRRISEAAARGEFIPYYQPVIDIQSGGLVGCEVLMRWRKPDGTIVEPAAFIRLAEASGLAFPMTLSLMRRVRAELGEAFGQRPDLTISINLFDGHFASLRTVKEIKAIFGNGKIAFGQLIFEVTERQRLANIKRARVVIRRLQGLGARLALDDTGAGHAGLAYLQQLGVDVVKIDKLFIEMIDEEQQSAPIVDSLIKLGHDLKMEVVAEGVETLGQLEYLRARGADAAQGYLFSPALPASAFLDLVEAMAPLGPRGDETGAPTLVPTPRQGLSVKVA
jgi:sensor c-di-GMP phosphodiesterase-like protein